MQFSKVTALYFSPTGNTKTCVRTVAKVLNPEYTRIDWTDYDIRHQAHSFAADELVIIGIPVYSGRIPVLPDGLLDKLKGQGTACVLMVSYGNRAYEDALLELKNTCENQGFIPLAAAAFIGQHTYSEEIARNRPDDKDIQALQAFAAAVQKKINTISSLADLPPFSVPGNQPYRKIAAIPIVPKAKKACNNCKLCVRSCPTKAIDPTTFKASKKLCIRCYACVNICPFQVRKMDFFLFTWTIRKMTKALAPVRREPETFL